MLGEYDSEIAAAIRLFWRLLDVRDIFDEQNAYFQLSEALRETDGIISSDDLPANIIFYGFSHLSASQIDFLKSLAIRSDVFIPLPKRVYDRALSTDWIKWLHAEVEDISSSAIGSYSELNYHLYPKNRLADILKTPVTP